MGSNIEMILRDLLSTFGGQKLRNGRNYRRLPVSIFQFSSTVQRFQSLKEIANSWVRRLKQEGVSDPDTSVKFICEHVLGKNNTYQRVCFSFRFYIFCKQLTYPCFNLLR